MQVHTFDSNKRVLLCKSAYTVNDKLAKQEYTLKANIILIVILSNFNKIMSFFIIMNSALYTFICSYCAHVYYATFMLYAKSEEILKSSVHFHSRFVIR